MNNNTHNVTKLSEGAGGSHDFPQITETLQSDFLASSSLTLQRKTSICLYLVFFSAFGAVSHREWTLDMR